MFERRKIVNPWEGRLVELAKPLNMGVAFDGCKVII